MKTTTPGIIAALALSTALFAAAPLAQAATYNVSATFQDGGVQTVTTFAGSFDWDGSTVSNFQGLLSESMWGWNSAIGHFDSNGTAAGGMSSGMSGGVHETYISNMATATDNQAPLLHLTHQLASSTSGGLVTVSTFLQNSTDVVTGGGYDVTGGEAMALGFTSPEVRNFNAFFTLSFNATDPTNVTQAIIDSVVYADMTALGMMGPMLTGWMGMTGYAGGGSMGGLPVALSITAAPVPVPAAVWLLGSAMVSLVSIGRRRIGAS